MEPMTIALVLGGVAGTAALLVKAVRAAVAHERRYAERLDAIWGEVAARLELRRPQKRLLEGTFQGFQARVEYVPAKDTPPATRVVLSGERIAPGVSISREGAFSGVRKAFTGEDVLVGDEAFDRLVHVQGPEDVALAALSADIRKPIQTWLGLGGAVQDGKLICYLPNDETGPERIPAALEEVAGFARALAVASVASALQAGVEADPAAGARLRRLKALLDHHSGTPQAKQALVAAIGDRDPEVCLLAAQHQGGARAAEALARIVLDAQVPEERRAYAVQLLQLMHPWTVARPVMVKALYTRGAAVRRAAVRAVAKARDASLLDDVISMLPTEDEELAEALAGAFEAFGGPRAEKALIDLLAMSSPVALEAAAEALGNIGTVTAVEPLGALVEKGPIKDVARDAVRAIQARLGDVAAGRLSVVGPGAGSGALSLEASSDAGEPSRERG